MADRLIQLSANPTTRRLITSLGLPVPLPQPLRRDPHPWTERPLQGRVITIGGDGDLAEVLAETLTQAGADPYLTGGQSDVWDRAGEAWGRPARVLAPGEVPERRENAFVFDATALKTPADLRQLYDFFHPRIRGLAKCGRVIVIGRPHKDAKTALAGATQRALDGFVKSVGREVGRKGSTATFITVQVGAEQRLPAVLRFFLSDRAAYVSGQVIRVTKSIKKAEARQVRPLQGKVALVTGSARGIGAATARTLAREGAKVIVLDIPSAAAPASAVAAEVGGAVFLIDVTEEGAPARIAAFVKERFGKLDILVNNAGITRDKTLAKMKPEWWDQTIGVNLIAVAGLTDALQPLMKSGGRVVCLSSIAGIAGNVGQTNYAASKAGVIGFVETLAPKMARKGIAVNAVAPGFIETRLTKAIPIATREVARRLANLSQGGLPQDVAEVLTFLSSPGACALNGQIVRVCGGNFVGA